jgi:DNA-binding NtrC family response regulator
MTTILLVEDDPLQAFLMLSLLRRRFDDVSRAADASEALCMIEQAEFACKLGLVISGHHVRGIGGPEFVAELHTRMPALPVLVLGAPGEAAGAYAQEHVTFRPRSLGAEEMLTLTNRLLSHGNNAAA